MLRKRFKHLKRYREIANILSKHGFGFLLEYLGLQEFSNPRRHKTQQQKISRLNRAERVRIVFEELGPTFIKLGQILSTRADLLDPEYISELEKLQDEVPSFEYAQVREQIELELGLRIEDIFSYFCIEPLAAASIGQVHLARLLEGEEVVVKVQRPGIKEVIETDLEILFDVARVVDKRTAWGKIYNFSAMVREFEKTLAEEMDYNQEASNAEQFRHNFSADPNIYFPKIYWDFTAKKVLTMEYVSGINLKQVEEEFKENNKSDSSATSQYDKKIIASRLAEAILKMMLVDGFFHADPHPGNISILPENRLVFYDFGLVGTLDQELKSKIIMLVLGLIRKKTEDIIKALFQLGVVPKHVEVRELRHDIEQMQKKYYEISLSKIDLKQSLNEIMDLSYKYKIKISKEFTLLVKVLITLEGVTAKLDPSLSIISIAEPLGKKLLKERLSPSEIKKSVLHFISEYAGIAVELPKRINEFFELASRGDIRLKLENRDLDRILARADILVNRLAFSIVVASLVVGSSFIVQRLERLFLLRFPVAEFGFLTAGFLGFWLLISIIRSGRL